MVVVQMIQKTPFLGKEVQTIYDFLVGQTAEDAFRARGEPVSEAAIKWLKRKRSGPFFLWLHYIDPYAPYDPVKKYSPALDRLTEGQERLLRGQGLSLEEVRWRGVDQEATKRLYEGETRYVDEQIGQILQFLEDEGYLDSSVVVLTSDHGEEFLDHGKLGHGQSLYEELVRVPLVIRSEAIEGLQSGVIEKLVNLVDLGPTLFDLLGFEFDKERSWFDDNYPPTIFVEATSNGPELRGAVRHKWKLIWNTFNDNLWIKELKERPLNPADFEKVGGAAHAGIVGTNEFFNFKDEPVFV